MNKLKVGDFVQVEIYDFYFDGLRSTVGQIKEVQAYGEDYDFLYPDEVYFKVEFYETDSKKTTISDFEDDGSVIKISEQTFIEKLLQLHMLENYRQLKVKSLDYVLNFSEKEVSVGCQSVKFEDALEIADIIYKVYGS